MDQQAHAQDQLDEQTHALDQLDKVGEQANAMRMRRQLKRMRESMPWTRKWIRLTREYSGQGGLAAVCTGPAGRGEQQAHTLDELKQQAHALDELE